MREKFGKGEKKEPVLLRYDLNKKRGKSLRQKGKRDAFFYDME